MKTIKPIEPPLTSPSIPITMYFTRGFQQAAKVAKDVAKAPKAGNSFKSFAEYRLKVTHQSPLSIKARSEGLIPKKH